MSQPNDHASLGVKVHPRARCDSVQLLPDGSLKVSVTAPPEGGKANEAVVALLARALGIAKKDVEVARGGGSRAKLVRVHGLTGDEVASRLRGAPGTVRPPASRARPRRSAGSP